MDMTASLLAKHADWFVSPEDIAARAANNDVFLKGDEATQKTGLYQWVMSSCTILFTYYVSLLLEYIDLCFVWLTFITN